ncbi:MAG: Radical protein [Acidimicrobiaceae bacterium]|nr:Radical protein [Acidimicrobiaceae bacterium]
MPVVRPEGLRWRLEDDEDDGRLFSGYGAEHRQGVGEYRGLELIHVQAATVLNRVPAASRMPFHWTINAYRGCSHACVYCFARPTHTYLGLGIGSDFDRKIVVKVNAVERVRAELRSSRWRGEAVAMGTNTDPYQLAEGRYHLTRGIIGELAAVANPFSILTKSTLLLRDLPLLSQAARRCDVRLAFSIGTLDRDVWHLTEPGTPPPERRLAAVRRCNDAGVPCSVLVAPVIPGLSDGEDQVRAVVAAAREAGAPSVSVIPLHLRPGVRQHYLDWLAGARPDLIELHEQRFGRRSQQSPRVRERLGELARDSSSLRPGGHRNPRPTRPKLPATERAVAPDQLALFSQPEASTRPAGSPG